MTITHHDWSPNDPVEINIDAISRGIVLDTVAHEGNDVRLLDVFTAAFPAEDASSLHFDLVGSDGFRPRARPACARSLTKTDLAGGHVDRVTHDVSFDSALGLPCCYRVKRLQTVKASR